MTVSGEPVLVFATRNFGVDKLEAVAGCHDSLDIVDDDGTTAVMHALMAGRIENAKLLHELGASLDGINDEGYSVRVLAEEAGLDDFGPVYPTELSGPKVDREDANLLLLQAAEAGDIGLVDLALSLGADLDAAADNGLQVAHLAALGGHEDAFDYVLSHDAAPSRWATFSGENTGYETLSLVDFIIAGEGRGSHERAGRMLARAMEIPAVRELTSSDSRRYRDALIAVGYPLEIVTRFFDVPELPEWEADIPYSSDGEGGTVSEWKSVQRFLNEEGLYSAGIDGIPGRGSLQAIIFHVADRLPTLLERVTKMRDVTNLSDDALSAKWKLMVANSDQWQLTQVVSVDGIDRPVGYYLVLPEGNGRETELSLGTPGIRFGYRSSDGGEPAQTLIEYAVASNDEDHVSSLQMQVFGQELAARFYEDRFSYQLQTVTRMYSSSEDVPVISDLTAQRVP